MIFKTFDSNIDKISAKWGIFGKSFNDIGNAIVGRIKDINKGFQATGDLLGSFKDTDSIWKRLYPSKEAIKSQMIDVNALYPEKTDAQFTKLLSKLTQQQNTINTTKGSWSDYFKNLGEGEKWQIEFVQNTDLQKASLDDVKKAYDAARDGAIAHNAALKQQTLSAKAGQVALKGLAIAGNMIAMWAISEVIGGVISYLDELSHKAQNIAEEAESKFSESNEKNETYKQNIKSLDEYKQKYQEILNSNDSEIGKRKSLLELQGNINKLVGTQCEGLDLVNGKLDDQIVKIEKITKSQKEQYYQNSVGNYTNAKRAANSSTGQVDEDGVTQVYVESNPDKDIIKILQENGYGDLYKSASGNLFVDLFSFGNSGGSININDGIDAYGNVITSLEDRVVYLKKLQEVLLKNGKGDSGLYGAVTSQIQKWEDSLKSQKSSAEDVIKSYIDLNANPENINSVDDYKNYIDTFTGEIKKDKNVSQIIKDGVLNDEDIKTIVNDYISVLDGFSEWYDKWKKNNIESDETDNLSKKSFKQIWDSLGTGDDETSKKVAEEKENLLKLAEAGQLTEEAFKDSSIADTFTEAGYSISEATKEVNGFIENVKQLNSMKTGISAITSAYDEKKDANDKRVGSDTLNSMYDTLGVKDWSKPDLKVWEQYKEVASSSKSTLKELKSAQDDLATSFVNSNNFLTNITDGTKDYYVSLLREMGVTNAAELATDALNRKKIEAKLASFDYASATEAEIEELNNYILSLGGTSSALANYMIQKQIASGALDTSGSIKNLINLAKQCGATTKVLEALQRVLNATNTLTNTKSKDLSEYNADAVTDLKHIGDDLQKQKDVDVEKDSIKLEKAKNKLNKLLKKARTAVETSKGNQDKNKDKGSGSGSNSKNTTKKEKTEINWLERRLTRMQSIIDITASKLQNLFSIKSKSNNLDKQIKQTTKLVKQYGHAYNVYMGKANKVAKASKKGKNKVPALSKDIINKVQSGEITKSSYRKLIKKYGQNYADKINSYIDYYDKAQEAKQNRQEQIAKKRQLKIDKKQLRVDKANAKIDFLEAKKEYATSSESKNNYLEKEKKYYQDSYKYQIQIAKLEGNKIEAQRLQVELQQKLRDIQKEQLENTENQQQAELDRIQAQKERAKDYGSKNNNIDAEIAKTNELYDTQIAIANLEGNTEEAQKLQIEREQQLIALQKEKFDNIANQYENQRRLTENSYKNLSNASDELEARGLIVGASLYSSQIDLNNAKKGGYEEELKLLESQLTQIEQGTSEWYDALDAIQSCKDGISEATNSVIELNKKIREIPFLINEKITSRLELISSEFDLIIKYLSNKKLIDDGTFTREGTGTLASYYSQLLLIQEEIDVLKPDIDELWNKIQHGDDDPSVLEKFYEKYPDYIELKNTEFDIQQSLIDMMKDKYEAELDYLQEIINKRKELLQAEKDAYDYQRTIEEKTNTVSTLKKQLNAISGDDSEEGKMRRQQLLVSLDEAKKDLQDTEYDKWISDQQEMLDNLYKEYEDFIDNHLNNVEGLLDEAINYLKDPATKTDFLDTWDTYMSKYDFQPESDLKRVLDKLGKGENGDIVAAINGVANTITSHYNKEQADINAAQAVVRKINELGNFGSDGWFTRLSEVNEMYKNLTDSQKSKVDSSSIATLNSANTQKQQWDAQQIANAEAAIKAQQETRKEQLRRNLDSYIKSTYRADRIKYATNISNASASEINIADAIKRHGLRREDGLNSPNNAAISQIVSWINSSGYGINISATADALWKYMQNIGYSQGGIVGTLQKVPGMNGDDGWVTLKKGEGILTPEQTKQFQTLAKNLDILNPAVDILSNIQRPNLDIIPNRNITQSVGDIKINMEFPNVTNYEEFRHKMQSDPKIEQMFKSMLWDKGDFSKYKINM